MQVDAAELSRPKVSVYVTSHCKKDAMLHIIVATRLCTRQFNGTFSCSVFEVGIDQVLISALASQDGYCFANGGDAGF